MRTTSRVLRISLVVTLAYIVLLVVAGLRAHSLALLSEAGHNLSDFVALLMSWGAVYLQGKPPSARKTFGYNRAGVLVAFVNGLSLVLIAFYILYEAFRRLQAPVDVHAGHHDLGGSRRSRHERRDRAPADARPSRH